MSRFEALAGMVAELRGAPASVLLAMILAGRPLSQRELVYLTGYSEKPVRRSVRLLLGHGTIRPEGPWAFVLASGWAGENPALAGIVDRYSQKLSEGEAALRAQEAQQKMATPPTLPGKAPKAEPGAGSTGGGAEKSGDTSGAEAGPDTEEPGLGETEAGGGVEIAGQAGAGEGSTGTSPAGEVPAAESRRDERPDVVVGYREVDRDQEDQQQQKKPDQGRRLAGLLRRMGINGRAFARLVNREDLTERPEAVLAWWWYYRAQEGVRNPAGAAIARLDDREEPPDGYLALAQAWPELPDGIRQEVASLYQHNWSAEQIAAMVQPANADLTAEAVRAYMAIYVAAGEELQNGEW